VSRAKNESFGGLKHEILHFVLKVACVFFWRVLARARVISAVIWLVRAGFKRCRSVDP